MRIFDTKSTANYRVKHSFSVSLHSNGVFRVSKTAAQLINLCEGEKISIIEEEGYWYLSKSTDGFEVKKDTKGSLHFYSRHVARIILEHFGMIIQGAYTFVVAKEPKEINNNQALLLINNSIKKR